MKIKLKKIKPNSVSNLDHRQITASYNFISEFLENEPTTGVEK